MTPPKTIVTYILTVFFLIGGLARADVIMGNLAGYTNSSGPGLSIGLNGQGGAVGFSMGETAYYLNNATVQLNLGTNTSNVPIVELWTGGTANAPVAYVTALSAPALLYDGGTHNYTYTLSAPLELVANQTYYLVLKNQNTLGSYVWNSGVPPVAPTGTGGSFRNVVTGTGVASGWVTPSTVYSWFQLDGPSINQSLPFNMPPLSQMRSSARKVYAHYFPTFPVSINNKDAALEYYTTQYLTPTGESNKHLSYGGFLRERTIPRAIRSEGNWKSIDRQLEVRRAAAIGIDGFACDIMSTSGGTFEITKSMLTDAAAVDPNFKIMLMPDMTCITDMNALTTAMQTLSAYPACLWTDDGRLVVAPYYAQAQTAAWWQNWIAQMQTLGINVALVPVFQSWRTYASSYQSFCYGFSDWGERSVAANQKSGWINAAADAHTYVPIWMHPVGPQYSRPNARIYYEAINTLNTRCTWEQGAINKADWVHLTTWNDYSEGGNISPSTGIQYLFYDLTAYYNAWYKTGTQPTVQRDAIFYCHRQQHMSNTPDYTQQTAPFVLKNGTAAVNQVEALVFLTADANLTISLGGTSATYPVSAPVASVTLPFNADARGVPAFTLTRSGTTVAAVQSAFPINSTIVNQDPLYHGGSSLRPSVPYISTAYYPKQHTLMDSFNQPAVYTQGGAVPPTSTLSPWAYTGQQGSGVTIVTSTTAESAFSATATGMGALITDTSTTYGSSSGITGSVPELTGSFTVAFDYQIRSSGSNNLVPEMILKGDYGSGTSGGVFIVLWSNGNFGYQGPSGSVTALCPVTIGTWYHVSATVNVAARTVSTTVTPYGGSPTTYPMSFRYNITSVNGFSFLSNTGASATGAWAIDNVTFTPAAP